MHRPFLFSSLLFPYLRVPLCTADFFYVFEKASWAAYHEITRVVHKKVRAFKIGWCLSRKALKRHLLFYGGVLGLMKGGLGGV